LFLAESNRPCLARGSLHKHALAVDEFYRKAVKCEEGPKNECMVATTPAGVELAKVLPQGEPEEAVHLLLEERIGKSTYRSLRDGTEGHGFTP
jgi:hypothetical protein